MPMTGQPVRPDVVLFDLDGTITDPRVDFTESLRYGLATVGVTGHSDAEIMSHLGPPLGDTLASFGLDAEGIEAARLAYRARYAERDSVGTFVHPGIAELVADLRELGCRLGVATSKPRRIAIDVLKKVGLLDAFDTFAGPGLDERDAAKDLVVAQALAQHGRPDPATVVMVGDRVFDIEGARAHGIDTISVTWGFAAPGELAAARPRVIVESADELRRELLGTDELRHRASSANSR